MTSCHSQAGAYWLRKQRLAQTARAWFSPVSRKSPLEFVAQLQAKTLQTVAAAENSCNVLRYMLVNPVSEHWVLLNGQHQPIIIKKQCWLKNKRSSNHKGHSLRLCASTGVKLLGIVWHTHGRHRPNPPFSNRAWQCLGTARA